MIKDVIEGLTQCLYHFILGSSKVYLTYRNTIYDNPANKGGDVYFLYANTANAYNNIIYGNTAMDGEDIYFDSVTNRIGYNNDYLDMDGTWTESGSNLDTNPLLVDPANNDFHLQPTSPMIDNGNNCCPGSTRTT